MIIFGFRRFVFALATVIPMMAGAQCVFVNTLMPEPQSVQPGIGAGLSITPQLSVSFENVMNDATKSAATRMISTLRDETGVRLADQIREGGTASIVIKIASLSEAYPVVGVDESYRLKVNGDTAVLQAQTIFGAYRAMETITQLVQPCNGSYIIPAVEIADAPRFPWRGLLLDPARHFLPVADVLRTIDGMAAVKLNVLHLHLSDDQGFRLESKRFPKLQELGSNGLFYTQQQMREIILYALQRGIRVVPEFDIPGHSTSWLVGYPELASAPGPYSVERKFQVFDAAIDPTRETTYQFLDQFFGEMSKLFPDPYMHIGGDESNGKQWRSNPKIIAFMKAHGIPDTNSLQAYFNRRVQEILKKHGKIMIGWDEILHSDLKPDVVVQNWHGTKFLIDAARQGHEGIFSQPYYLDHTYSAGTMYAADPIPSGEHLSPSETRRILGGEACMWGEMVTFQTIDSRIWPRAAAVAERFWSAQSVRNVDDMYRRLRVESQRLDGLRMQQISGPERLLRQISRPQPIPAIDVLAGVLSPVDFAERLHRQRPTEDTAMTIMVDAVVPDPPLEEDFANTVAAYLHSDQIAVRIAARAKLYDLFHSWIAASSKISLAAASDPQLQTIATRSSQLAQLGRIGLDAIEPREGGKEMQIGADSRTLQAISKPDESLTVFVVLDPLWVLLAAQK